MLIDRTDSYYTPPPFFFHAGIIFLHKLKRRPKVNIDLSVEMLIGNILP